MADKKHRHDLEDEVRHTIEEEPTGDAEKGAALGGLGGAAVGAAAGMAAGPAGAVAGALIGGLAGAIASGVAVAAVDRMDNDHTVSGVGTATHDPDEDLDDDLEDDDLVPGNRVPGIQTGGHAVDGTPDTRGMTEKTADALTGDRIDDKTGKVVDDDADVWPHQHRYNDPDLLPGNDLPGIQTGGRTVDGGFDTRGMMEKAADALTSDAIDDKTGKRVYDPDLTPGNDVPGIQTGGRAADGTPDTRGISEKAADAVTGDRTDDKTGKRV